MITVTNQEHLDKVASAEATFKAKAWDCLCDMERGADIKVVKKTLIFAHANLKALGNYKSGKFEPYEFFNVVSPIGETSLYSNLNNIK